MVSNAREDLPEPERPVITTSLSLGMVTSTFLRLCSLAPFITISLIGIGILYSPFGIEKSHIGMQAG